MGEGVVCAVPTSFCLKTKYLIIIFIIIVIVIVISIIIIIMYTL